MPTPPINPSIGDGSSTYEFDLPEPTELYGELAWRLLKPGATSYFVVVEDIPRTRVRLTIGTIGDDAHINHYLPLGVGEALGRMLIAADLAARRQAEASGGAS